jgi:hypothetical protein
MYSLIENKNSKPKVYKQPNKKAQNPERAKRTRQLIQIGGLVDKSGLTNLFDIAHGMDLQNDQNKEKAAVLLGFLSESCDNVTSEIHTRKHETWKARGLSMLREKG